MRLVVVVCFVLTVILVMGENNGEMKIREEKESNRRVKSEYLISKWKTWFEWFDNDKDGKVRITDLELARNKFIKLHHIEAEQAKEVSEKFSKWWRKYVMWAKSEITEEEFVTFQNEAFQADKGKFLQRMQRNQNIIGNIVDANGDGYISEEEYIIMCKAGGPRNEALDKKFFKTFNPVDGKILTNVFIDEWIVFLTSEESSKPDVVKTAFEGVI